MKRTDLNLLKRRLDALAIYRELLADPVVDALCRYLAAPAISAYGEFVSALYRANGGDLCAYLRKLCENSENIYVRTVGQGISPAPHLCRALEEELTTLQMASDLTPADLLQGIEAAEYLPTFNSEKIDLAACIHHRAANIRRYGYGIYAENHMFYLDAENCIVPVLHPDPILPDDLVDYTRERQIVLDNTRALLDGKPAANILLSGDAGTGKSSTVKAVGNALFAEGLRVIEVRKDQLSAIPGLLDELSGNPLKFILFIDDLSFLKDDDNFNALKALLEGSVSAKSSNVVIYATSNRRHIIRETFSDREGDDIHRNDTMQEMLSLSGRFGIHITFGKPNRETYLRIVHRLAEVRGVTMPHDELDLLAERFALERGGRSARLAGQLINQLLAK